MISEDSIEKMNLLLEQLEEDMKQVGITDDDMDDLFGQLNANENEPTTYRAWIIVKHLSKFEKCLHNQVNRGEKGHRQILIDIRRSIQYLTSGILNDMIMIEDALPSNAVSEYLHWLKRTNPEEHNPDFHMCLEKDPNNPISYTVKHHLQRQTPQYLSMFIEKTQDDDFELLSLSGLFTIKPGTKKKVFQAFKELILDQPHIFPRLSRKLSRPDINELVDLIAGGNDVLKRTFLSSLPV